MCGSENIDKNNSNKVKLRMGEFMENKITTKMMLKDNLLSVMRIDNIDYISLSDLARYKNESNLGDVVIKWMNNKSLFDFYCLQEELFNEKFNIVESRKFKNDSANKFFTMSSSRLISMTNAKGFVSKSGKYNGGTFAHPDITLEFASWIDPVFKLYLIQEFERLKVDEVIKNQLASYYRILSKLNYVVHIDALKEYILLKFYEKQIKFIYAEEVGGKVCS